MRLGDPNLYVNTLGGGGLVFDVSSSSDPFFVSYHDVQGWVSGLYSSGEVVFRRSGEYVQAAVPE